MTNEIFRLWKRMRAIEIYYIKKIAEYNRLAKKSWSIATSLDYTTKACLLEAELLVVQNNIFLLKEFSDTITIKDLM
ncbi:MAG: hypothetical protein ACRC5M_03610 [Anaeroplasmataceae bacterium]